MGSEVTRHEKGRKAAKGVELGADQGHVTHAGAQGWVGEDGNGLVRCSRRTCERGHGAG